MTQRGFDRWLARVANRVRIRRALVWLSWALLGWGAGAVALLLLARIQPLGWEESVALLALPVVAIAGFVTGLVQPLGRELVARAADRDLAAADRLGTATEFDPSRAVRLEHEQAADAARYASAHRTDQAAPMRWPERRLLVAAGLAALVGLLVVVENPMDAVIERRAAEQKLLEAAAADVERGAREIERAPISEDEKRELLEELHELAASLKDAPSVEEAMQELLASQRRLAAMQTGDHIATKTLTQSFERSLQDDPLSPGNSGSAAEQLSQLAAEAEGLSPKQREAASDRLDQLAAALESVDPELAAALAAAASQLAEGGDPQALAQAAEALDAAEASIAAQEAVAATGAQLGNLSQALAAASAALAQGQGQGQGQGAGQGQGQGEGQGEGQGQGRGGGQGQGQGAGAASGQVGGTNANSSTGATGGPGQANGSGNNPSKADDDAPVFDPVFGEDIAERLRVTGGNQGGRNSELGTQIGAGREGEILIPYSYVYPEWSARAARSVDTLAIPASLRAFVRAYFRSLAPEEAR